MLAERKRIEIENICRTYVANDFAIKINPEYRGAAFSWCSWADTLAKASEDWLFIQNIKGDLKTNKEFAASFTHGLCLDLIRKSGVTRNSQFAN